LLLDPKQFYPTEPDRKEEKRKAQTKKKEKERKEKIGKKEWSLHESF
jgi:hypothetical protein